QLFATGAGPRGGNSRELARAAPLPQHGPSARAQEGGAAPCGLTPDPFSLAPCSLGQGRCAPAPPVPPPLRRHPLLPLRAALCQKAGRDEGMVISDRTKGCCY